MKVLKNICLAAIAALLIFQIVDAVGQDNSAAAAKTVETPLLVITLDDAIRRASSSDPNFASAVARQGVSRLDRSIARSSLLPGVVYHNQYLYTQPNGETIPAGASNVQGAPKFIANNAVHEYTSQAVVNETVGVQQFAEYRRTGALATQAAAQLEMARRGLVASVVDAYYTLLAADQKLLVAQHAAKEAQDFLVLTQKLEAGGEVAHSDVVKGSLQTQQRERDLAEAELTAKRARLDLGVLLFPDPRTPYALADDASQQPTPPLRAEVEAAASKSNPELKSALAAVRVANEEVNVARGAYFPELALNYTYGIDAPQFAVNGQDGIRNLGYSASATLDIPVWDWLATHNRVKQSELQRAVAKTELSFAQRRLIAQLEELYGEVQAANDSLLSLGRSVSTARESVRLVNLRYASSEGTVLEVVDAQNTLLSAESAQSDGIVRYRLALANLQTLTGNMP